MSSSRFSFEQITKAIQNAGSRAPSAAETDNSRVSEEDWAFESLHQQEQLETLKNNRDLRTKYAKYLFWYLVTWSAFVAIVVFLEGFECIRFALESSVLSVLLGTTTVSVLGLMLAILRGLFPVDVRPDRTR